MGYDESMAKIMDRFREIAIALIGQESVQNHRSAYDSTENRNFLSLLPAHAIRSIDAKKPDLMDGCDSKSI